MSLTVFPNGNRDDLFRDPTEAGEVPSISLKVNHTTLKEGDARVNTVALTVFLLSKYL